MKYRTRGKKSYYQYDIGDDGEVLSDANDEDKIGKHQIETKENRGEMSPTSQDMITLAMQVDHN